MQIHHRPLAVGSPTPWGPAQHVEILAPGIEQVDTAGHGGIRLSPERLAAMPASERSSDGWYEEDCEALWPLVRFGDEIDLPANVRRAVEQSFRRYGSFEKVHCRRPAAGFAG